MAYAAVLNSDGTYTEVFVTITNETEQWFTLRTVNVVPNGVLFVNGISPSIAASVPTGEVVWDTTGDRWSDVTSLELRAT